MDFSGSRSDAGTRREAEPGGTDPSVVALWSLKAAGDMVSGTPRSLNEGVLWCVRLYGAFPCVRLGKEDRGRLLEDFSSCFGLFGILKDSGRELGEDVP